MPSSPGAPMSLSPCWAPAPVTTICAATKTPPCATGRRCVRWLSSQPNPVGAARAFWASEWDYKFHDATAVLRGTAKNIKAKPIALFVPVAVSKAAARAGSFQLGHVRPDIDDLPRFTAKFIAKVNAAGGMIGPVWGKWRQWLIMESAPRRRDGAT